MSLVPKIKQRMFMLKYVVAHFGRKVGVGIGVIDRIVHFFHARGATAYWRTSHSSNENALM